MHACHNTPLTRTTESTASHINPCSWWHLAACTDEDTTHLLQAARHKVVQILREPPLRVRLGVERWRRILHSPQRVSICKPGCVRVASDVWAASAAPCKGHCTCRIMEQRRWRATSEIRCHLERHTRAALLQAHTTVLGVTASRLSLAASKSALCTRRKRAHARGSHLHRHHDNLERRVLGEGCVAVCELEDGDAEGPDVGRKVVLTLLYHHTFTSRRRTRGAGRR